MDSKAEFRKKFLTLRRDIVDRTIKDKAVLDKLLVLSKFKNAKKIFCYVNTGGEVDTKGIFEYCIGNKIEIWMPVILNNGNMCGVKAEKTVDIKYFSPTTCLFIDKNKYLEFDMIITPLVAVDIQKNRLGRGGGYYDKFLSKLSVPFTSIGLAYDEQVSSEYLPAEAHDMPLDIIITPTKVIK